ncbi:hypothetical protein R3P38DRAFT_3292205 [Favolaschia claudopus]|uniref:Uncharacterized protein n=1 Tax=Favolaschia claudopus TaxID=2862362 RepID=A0AAV9ZKV8_9AGAR
MRTDSRLGTFKFSHPPALSSSSAWRHHHLDSLPLALLSVRADHSILNILKSISHTDNPTRRRSFPFTCFRRLHSHPPQSAVLLATPPPRIILTLPPPLALAGTGLMDNKTDTHHLHTLSAFPKDHTFSATPRRLSCTRQPRGRRPHFAADADAYPIHIGACRPSFILPRFTNNTPPPCPSRPLPDLSNDSPPRLSSPALPPEPSATPHPEDVDFPDTHARCVEMAAPNLFRELHRRCHSKTLVSSRPAASLPSRTGIPHSQNSPPNFSAVGSILLVST